MKIFDKIKSILRQNSRHIELKIREKDFFLVSYPKSGNTWMRFLLMNYLFNEKKKKLIYSDLETFIPSLHKSTAANINSHTGLRIIKSHFIKEEYPQIIYIVRDGRDSLVSYYYYLKDLKGFEGSFEDFYYSDFGKGIGRWDEHVRSALEYRDLNNNQIVIVKYEDLKKDCEKMFKKVLNFLRQEINEENLRFAINSSAFDNLKKIQNTSGVVIENKEVNFFRKGISRQWPEYFNEKMHEDFIKKSGDILKKLQYSIS